MKTFARGLSLASLLTLACVALPAHAGRNCEARLPDAWGVQRSMNLAVSTAKALDDSGAQVVLLARAGQDLSKYRLSWSHMGWAYRETAAQTDGAKSTPVWRVVHKLNQCGSDRGDLYRQGLGEFFMDDPVRFEAAFVVPNPEVQARLLAVLQNKRRVDALHSAPYSMVAYPWAQTYQQSNQWALETLAYAVEPTSITRERAQAWLRFKGYEPTVLRISPLTRLGARISTAHIAFDDHPNDKRFSDRIETVTVDSAFDWLERAGMGGSVQRVYR